MSVFEELKRRNVFRVGIAYAVASWVLLQVVDLVLDNSEAPGWVMDVFMMVVVLGFIVSLIIAWAYMVAWCGPVLIRKACTARRQNN